MIGSLAAVVCVCWCIVAYVDEDRWQRGEGERDTRQE
jgi:hypothetical protein